MQYWIRMTKTCHMYIYMKLMLVSWFCQGCISPIDLTQHRTPWTWCQISQWYTMFSISVCFLYKNIYHYVLHIIWVSHVPWISILFGLSFGQIASCFKLFIQSCCISMIRRSSVFNPWTQVPWLNVWSLNCFFNVYKFRTFSYHNPGILPDSKFLISLSTNVTYRLRMFTGFVTKLATPRESHVRQDLFTLPEHLRSSPVFYGLRVA